MNQICFQYLWESTENLSFATSSICTPHTCKNCALVNLSVSKESTLKLKVQVWYLNHSGVLQDPSVRKGQILWSVQVSVLLGTIARRTPKTRSPHRQVDTQVPREQSKPRFVSQGLTPINTNQLSANSVRTGSSASKRRRDSRRYALSDSSGLSSRVMCVLPAPEERSASNVAPEMNSSVWNAPLVEYVTPRPYLIYLKLLLVLMVKYVRLELAWEQLFHALKDSIVNHKLLLILYSKTCVIEVSFAVKVLVFQQKTETPVPKPITVHRVPVM